MEPSGSTESPGEDLEDILDGAFRTSICLGFCSFLDLVGKVGEGKHSRSRAKVALSCFEVRFREGCMAR